MRVQGTAEIGSRGWRPPDSGAAQNLLRDVPLLKPPATLDSLCFLPPLWDFSYRIRPEALRRPSGQLLRQRHFLSDVAASLMPAVAQAANPLSTMLRRHCVSAVVAQTTPSSTLGGADPRTGLQS